MIFQGNHKFLKKLAYLNEKMYFCGIQKRYINPYFKYISMRNFEELRIAVAGTGYVGLSMATLLSQHHPVKAVDVVAEKVDKINHRISPIQDEYIEKYFAEKDLQLTATLDAREA